MLKNKVEELLETALTERPDLFLIDLTVSGDNSIKVIIDGDKGVLVEDCMFVSRAIEHNLDREEQDFSLEVMSAGATAPLVNKRQYKKNLKRTLAVKTASGKTEGVLTKATDNDITLEWKVREPKPVGKGKITVKKEAKIAFDDIVEAKVMIKF
ncbi:ribosome assembly cofactor RimP [Sabulilitoribacter multivorans]|jgi:ribosome maturation factor RimP|uniref:Ribosome maturation factor RimP n=1 Tax=Flaviramulus multivorans TaxID=1304750 RepID=A0ABS9IFG9_9FLAO|nr:ribosome assembly cofactor RimP [Flaviramulus multivorans]MCF7559281.1 ribosome assembly cofactor RimP [Flaviramulus multivorans]